MVETVRSVAEFMIWGDQHDASIYDFFLENNILVRDCITSACMCVCVCVHGHACAYAVAHSEDFVSSVTRPCSHDLRAALHAVLLLL